MQTLLFLSVRALHVVLAGAWLGAAMFAALYLVPVVREMGPAGAPVLKALVRRGLVKYMASIGGLTVVTGVYLFWRFTGGFDPAISASRAGMAFSVGALTGLIALILGGSMVGASAKKLVALDAQAARMPEGAERAALMKTMDGLRARLVTFGRIVVLLLLISMVAMALGHYI
jgi:hypothetical protein